MHALWDQKVLLQRLFPHRWHEGVPEWDLPLFPTRAGTVCDKENITDKCVKAVRGIIDKPEFSLEDVKKANSAMEGICKWAMAMMKYYDLLKIVNPMREKVAEMNA